MTAFLDRFEGTVDELPVRHYAARPAEAALNIIIASHWYPKIHQNLERFIQATIYILYASTLPDYAMFDGESYSLAPDYLQRAARIHLSKYDLRRFLNDPEGVLHLPKIHVAGTHKTLWMLKGSKGFIDILKLDCEDAERGFLEHHGLAGQVDYLALEYHNCDIRADKVKSTFHLRDDIHEHARQCVSGLGFNIERYRPTTTSAGIILARSRTRRQTSRG